MTRELAAKLARQVEKLACQVFIGRAIHTDGMPLPRRSTQLQVQRVLRGAAIALIAIALLSCRRREEAPKGDILATLDALTLEGTKFDASTLKGKPTLLMFVSPTCPHCLDQIPVADRVAKEHGANAVAVFIAGKAENAKGVIAHTKFAGAALIDDGSLRRRYGVRAVPYTLVLGPDGHAREAMRGAQGADTLEEALDDAR